jgi:ubiquinone/menaquinone biosynthesis C-methylase UbiE
VKKYYDEKSTDYDANNELLYFKVYDAVTWKYTEPYVPKDSGALVLDAAGGTGKWSIPIAKCGPKVVLTDLSDGMLDVAREKIKKSGLGKRVDVRKGDVRGLDFEDETFDMVFMDHALCFIQEQGQVVSELVRVLKRNCPLVISGQNRYVLSLSLLKDDVDLSLKILQNEVQFAMRGLLKVYPLSPEEFRLLLEKSGVRVDKIIGKGVTMPMALPQERFWTKDYSKDFFDRVLKIELNLCEKPDALALAGHFQAIGYKRGDV